MRPQIRVLGVDDNPRNLAILAKALGDGFAFTAAASGAEALEKAAQVRPDVILLDLMMPGLDGYETCRRIRADVRLRHAKVILVSAKGLTAERLEGYHAGADDYLVKPFDPDELVAKVRVYARLKNAEETRRLKSDVLSLLDHETRTPLSAILGALPFLLDAPDLDPEQRRMLEIMDAGARRLLATFEKISMLSQLKADIVAMEFERHGLDELVRAGIERCAPAAAAREVRIAHDAGTVAAVEADAGDLTWVVVALLDNAVRFSPPGGEVRVRTRATPRGASLSVSDQGPGVPVERWERLFDGFEVGDLRHHTRGTGLSLAIAREIVDRHGGTLAIVPPEAGGATFLVELPAAAAERAAA
jgi:two-component system sensor histidine kinase/response regulator